jgi:hypothetical protein
LSRAASASALAKLLAIRSWLAFVSAASAATDAARGGGVVEEVEVCFLRRGNGAKG